MQDAFGHPQSVVVLGGTSDIAREIVNLLAAQRCRTVVLAGRDTRALERTASELGRTVTNVATVAFGATATDEVDKTITLCFDAAGEPVDLVIMAVGELGNQEEDESDPDRVAQMVTVNVTWPAAALTAVAGRLQRQGHGRIVVLSSVAGYRVRRSNFIYGAAKAGLDGFALGLERGRARHGDLGTCGAPGIRPHQDDGRTSGGPVRRRSRARGQRRRPRPGAGDTVIWSPGTLKYVFSVMRLLPQALWRRLPG